MLRISSVGIMSGGLRGMLENIAVFCHFEAIFSCTEEHFQPLSFCIAFMYSL